jgi:acetyl-CoA carboxylase carboxyl transferase subunit beta
MPEFLDDRQKKLNSFRKDILKRDNTSTPINIPEGVFVQCESCLTSVFQRAIDDNDGICPNCGHHFRIGAARRLHLTLDPKSFVELDQNLISVNPLSMPEYDQKRQAAQTETQMNEAFVSGVGTIKDIKVAIGVLDSAFMMGSMGSVVGEKVTRLIEHATANALPLIIFSASGGARMQEGILSLMQMVKTSAALAIFHEKHGFYISVLTNPTTGGVAASFASLGDVNIAEKSALIGFAGPRVIKQTIKQDLPEGFQTDLFQLQHGQVDLIVDRKQMRPILAKLLKWHEKKGKWPL